MTLEPAILTLRNVLDLCSKIFLATLVVGQIVGHLNCVSNFEMIENIRSLFNENTQTLSRYIPQLELVK